METSASMESTVGLCGAEVPTPRSFADQKHARLGPPDPHSEEVGVRGSPERDISSLRAFGPGGRQVLRVVRVARALFDVFEEK